MTGEPLSFSSRAGAPCNQLVFSLAKSLPTRAPGVKHFALPQGDKNNAP